MRERASALVAPLLQRRLGLRLDGAAAGRVARAVRAGARDAGCSEEAYAAAVRADPEMLADLVDRVTVQESSFFRHEPQFALVAEEARAHGGGVIWSAGCGKGQEPWSLAMLLVEQGLGAWSVLATDVSRAALAWARAGRYTERQLRGLSAERRTRFLHRVQEDFEIVPELRRRVRFAEHNLVTAPIPPGVDGRIVLCRNVLIYLHREAAEGLLGRLRDRMPQDGLLLIGGAETISADHPSFALTRRDGVFALRPRA